MKKYPKIIEKLLSTNKGHLFKIRVNLTKSGVYSVYFDYSVNGQRQYEFLKRNIYGDNEHKVEDDNIIREIQTLRTKRESDYFLNGHELPTKPLTMTLGAYLEYYKKDIKNNSSVRNLTAHIKRFNDKVFLRSIDVKYCQELANSMAKTVKPSTVHIYLTCFKTILNRAIKENLITKNPAREIKIKVIENKRDFLTEEEVTKLSKYTSYINGFEETKNAFLLSCFTGLRYSDLLKLKWNDIVNDQIYITQKKTSQVNTIPLTNDSRAILDIQKVRNPNGLVFKLPGYTTIKYHVQRLLMHSQIELKGRNITFHCARHTFAVMALRSGVGIYTVSKLLGHTDIKTTEVYLHIVDNDRIIAMDKLPDLIGKN